MNLKKIHSIFHFISFFSFLFLCIGFSIETLAIETQEKENVSEWEDEQEIESTSPQPTRTIAQEKQPLEKGATYKTKQRKRKYHVSDPNRVDAGVFHAGFGVGGNFYVEPEIAENTFVPTGSYFQEFGFQGAIFFDYDYSALTENVPFGIRAAIGYKYILSSVHAFAFDGTARYIFRVSDNANFGIGVGGSLGLWIRKESDTPPKSKAETILLPCFVFEVGFDFTPFFTDLKMLLNKIGEDSSVYGLELYVGIQL